MVKFSVVIPTYNSEETIERCLQSVLEQTYPVYELLVVDDASSDNTVKVASEYLEKSSISYRIIEKETNSGPGDSRNIGISLVTGDYVAFLDSDDWYALDFLENTMAVLTEHDSDVVLSEHYKFYHDKRVIKVALPVELSHSSSKKEIIAFASQALWLMVIRAELLKKLSIPHLYNCEDAALVPIILLQAQKINLLRRPTYYYYQRQNSLSNAVSIRTVHDMLDAFSFIEENCDSEFRDEVEYLGIKIVLYGAVLNAIKSGENPASIFQFVDRFVEKYPNWYHNQYKHSLGISKKVFLRAVHHRSYGLLRCLTYSHSLLTRGS